MNYKDMDIVSLHKESFNPNLTQKEKNKAYAEFKKKYNQNLPTKEQHTQMIR